eukprot:2738801-Prymnesium_polylepis.1
MASDCTRSTSGPSFRRPRRGLPRERHPKTQPIEVVVVSYAYLHNATGTIGILDVLVVGRTEAHDWLERQSNHAGLAL